MSGSHEIFEAHRVHLFGIAYRMLGSLAEAEDVVQDSYLRFREVDAKRIEQPRAYLSKVVTRLALDRLKAARSKREQYVGTWLPEPLVEASDASPAAASDLAHDLSMALLMTLERLSPLERAAFLLHDVFDVDYASISETLERPEAACRKLVSRARVHLHDGAPRFARDLDQEARLTEGFMVASSTGDVDALSRMLAEDVTLYSDGGGKRRAALNPVRGRARVARFFLGVRKKRLREGRMPSEVRPARINGQLGFVLRDAEGYSTVSFEVGDGVITAVYLVSNPDKLGHLS